MIKEIIQLITDDAPGIDKDSGRILELIYQYAEAAYTEGYRRGRLSREEGENK
jgi:hypothetical protein